MREPFAAILRLVAQGSMMRIKSAVWSVLTNRVRGMAAASGASTCLRYASSQAEAALRFHT